MTTRRKVILLKRGDEKGSIAPTPRGMLVAARTPGLELQVLNAPTVLRTRAREQRD
jgi:hypothetical protein